MAIGRPTAARGRGFATGRLDAVDFLQANAARRVRQREPVDRAIALAVGALACGRWRGDVGEFLRFQQARGAEVEGGDAGGVEVVVAEDGDRGSFDDGEVEGDEVFGYQVEDDQARGRGQEGEDGGGV